MHASRDDARTARDQVRRELDARGVDRVTVALGSRATGWCVIVVAHHHQARAVGAAVGAVNGVWVVVVLRSAEVAAQARAVAEAQALTGGSEVPSRAR